MFTGILLDLRQSIRSLRKTPGIVLAVLATLALGVGVNTAMFSIVNAVVLAPLPYPAPDRLVSLWPEKRWSVQMIRDVQDRVTSYDAVSGSTTASYTLLGEGPAESIQVGVVSAAHFDVLGVRPFIGTTFAASDATAERGPVVVLSHGFWQRRFGGDAGVVGRRITLAGHGLTDRTIIGVLPAGFWPSTSDAWVPIITTPGQPGSYAPYGLTVTGRLRPGVSAEQARQELRGLVQEFTPMHPTQFRPIRYSPVDVVPMLDNLVKDVRARLWIALGAVAFILLIACTNVANLLLARAQGRQREIAVQMALGCSARRVVRQVIAESLLLATLGGGVGVLTAALMLPLIGSFVSGQLPRVSDIELDHVVLAFALGVSLLAGLIFGAVPAMRAIAAKPGHVMRAAASRSQTAGGGARRVNDLLVVAQVALCLVLLAGAGLMVKSLSRLAAVTPGFDAEHVLTLQLTLPPRRYDDPAAREALRQRVEERLRAVPGVAAVGSIDYLPLGGGVSGIPYAIDGRERPATAEVVSARVISPGYLETMRVPVVAGRALGAQDSGFGGEVSLLVNESFARLHWPNGTAIGGRVLSAGGQPLGTIVGVVRDVRQVAIAEPALPEIYLPATQAGWPISGAIVLRGQTAVPPQDTVVKALQSVEPEFAPRNIRSMADVIYNSSSGTRFYATLLAGFAGVALLLALVGVYGVVSYAVARRTRELGVRLAIGATGRDLLGSVLARAIGPVLLGVVVGTAAAVALTRLLASLVFDVRLTDPWVLGGTALAMVAAATAAALVPAARAARLSPLRAMQAD
jgi:putative ABC transport system permease protein